MFSFQSGAPQASTSDSTNWFRFKVQSLTHFDSPPDTNAPLVPLRLKARISLAPTHLVSQTARQVGIRFVRHCSRSDLPRIPCGMLRLRRRSGMAGSARSRSHASLFVSVRVTRGGSLKVFFAVTELSSCRFSRAVGRRARADAWDGARRSRSPAR